MPFRDTDLEVVSKAFMERLQKAFDEADDRMFRQSLFKLNYEHPHDYRACAMISLGGLRPYHFILAQKMSRIVWEV